MVTNLAIAACTALLLSAVSNPTAEQIRALTDNQPARIVWCQQVRGGSQDIGARKSQFQLMGFDTEDGQGERVILSGVGNYHKPMFSSDGQKVVFSDVTANVVYCVNWDGSDLRKIAGGQAADVWNDPSTGIDWVYLLVKFDGPDFSGSPVYRYRLDDPSVREPVWSRTYVAPDNFQLSADGRYASGLFPWPAAGMADLARQTWQQYGKGCWTSLSPDNSYRLWIFNSNHRTVTIYNKGGKGGRAVAINTAPSMGGRAVYHPRWSNKSKFFVVTGPYCKSVPEGGNNIEIYIGKFNDNCTAVVQWQQVTQNSFADFYPDLWIGGNE